MRVERRAQLEHLWRARKLVEPEEMPIIATLGRHLELVARDIEGGAFPSVGRLHLDEAVSAFEREAGDVVAGAIAVLLRDPANPPCQILAAAVPQDMDLMMKHAFFAGMAHGAIALIPASRVETSCDALRLLEIF